MISVIEERLVLLGSRLHEFRIDRDESQERFAARLGVSIPTLRKLEKGDPTVSVGKWAEALWLLDRLGDLDLVLKKEETLFDQYEKRKTGKRQRASKR
ncbi:MAG: XRE family transcriptional regulator [Desulfobacteraceae bacterium]|nr:MAG: XRE family transcriptional regulator [Desulfobacteraceae bacterium]